MFTSHSEPGNVWISSHIILYALYVIALQLQLVSCYNVFDDYKGAYALNTSGDLYSCSGAFSCQLMNVARSTLCQGSHSCSNMTLISTTERHPLCSGANSCAFSRIHLPNSGSTVICDGFFSCAQSSILAYSIVAAGSYALYKSVIVSAKNNSRIVLWADYAGYGATFVCQANHHCHIYCNAATACYMLFMNCTGECHEYNYVTDKSQYKYKLPTTNITKFQTLSNSNDVYQMMCISLHNNQDCEATSANMRFDSGSSIVREEIGKNIISTNDSEAPICCRGSASCHNFSISYESTANAKANVICSADASCRSTRINMSVSNGSVFCEAWYSCTLSEIYSASVVYCTGYMSCTVSTIVKSPRILCTGSNSCQGSTIISLGSDLNVHFGGKDSGNSAMIYCNVTDSCNITCAGYDACLDTKLICDGICRVECTEKTQCPVDWSLIPTRDPTTMNPIAGPTYYPTITTMNPSAGPTYYSSNPTLQLYTTQYRNIDNTSSTITLSPKNTITDSELSDDNDDDDDDDRIRTIVLCWTRGIILVSGLLAIATVIYKYKYTNPAPAPAPALVPAPAPAPASVINNKVNNKQQGEGNVMDESPSRSSENMYENNDEESLESMYDEQTANETKQTATEEGISIVYDETEGATKETTTIIYKERRNSISDDIYADKELADPRHDVVSRTQPKVESATNYYDKYYADRASLKEWLQMKVKLPQYSELFVQNGYDTLDDVKQITDANQLSEIGIHKYEHVNKLMKEIRGLKDFEKGMIADNKLITL